MRVRQNLTKSETPIFFLSVDEILLNLLLTKGYNYDIITIVHKSNTTRRHIEAVITGERAKKRLSIVFCEASTKNKEKASRMVKLTTIFLVWARVLKTAKIDL